MKPARLVDAINRISAIPSVPTVVSTARNDILNSPAQALKGDEDNVAQTYFMKEMVDNFCDLHPSTGRSLPVCNPLSCPQIANPP